MTYTFQPQGVCSRAMMVEVDEQGVIQEMQVLGGCQWQPSGHFTAGEGHEGGGRHCTSEGH